MKGTSGSREADTFYEIPSARLPVLSRGERPNEWIGLELALTRVNAATGNNSLSHILGLEEFRRCLFTEFPSLMLLLIEA